VRDGESIIAGPIKLEYFIGFKVSYPFWFAAVDRLTPDVGKTVLASNVSDCPTVGRPTHTCRELKFSVEDFDGRTAIDRQNGKPRG
jgi:hypothetical protein